ncbi:MAG: DUF87 domain-containing protein [Candidatus Peribacteria bacterium]|nr:MAG: DUF87 domain-containing protein [Candidatus Peribacteria bacterium]
MISLTKKVTPDKPTPTETPEQREQREKDEAAVKQYQQSKGELFLSVSYALVGADEYTTAAIEDALSKSWKTFVPMGSLSFKPKKPSYQGMSRSQACNFFHIPTKANPVKQLEYAVYRKLPFPTHLPTLDNTPHGEVTIIGKTDFKGQHIPFGIRTEDKFRHMYIIGKTGTGKSTFLSNMIRSDMYSGSGLCLIDPHGDLVDTVLEHVPSHRSNDVVLFDVGDQEFPIGFNLLQYKTPDEKLRIVSGVVSVFHKLFGHSRGPRLEYILRNVLLTLVDYPNATILHLMRVLTDKNFREEVLSHLDDAVVMRFWRDEFDKRNDKQIQEAIGPITNKV